MSSETTAYKAGGANARIRNFSSTIHHLGFFFRCVFLPDSGAFFVNYVITSALIGTAFELVRLPELFLYAVRMCYTHNEGERLLVKKVWLSTVDYQRSLMFRNRISYGRPAPLTDIIIFPHKGYNSSKRSKRRSNARCRVGKNVERGHG